MLRTVISMRGGLIGCPACKYFNSMALDEVGMIAIIKSDGSPLNGFKIVSRSKPRDHYIIFPRHFAMRIFAREGDNV